MKNKNIQLRNRGQVTIPKEFLDRLKVKQNDFLSAYLDEENERIILEVVKPTSINFADELEKYIIADLKSQGLTNNEIKLKLASRKQQLEENYAQYLAEIDNENEFVDCDDW